MTRITEPLQSAYKPYHSIEMVLLKIKGFGL